MILDYFYGQAGELFSFYRIPKALFQEPRFQSLSTDAKILYGILLDRMSLSVKNGWLRAVKQDAVQGFCIGGQTLEPWLLKKSLGNAVERKQFSGLSVEIIKDHAGFFNVSVLSLLCKNLTSFRLKK